MDSIISSISLPNVFIENSNVFTKDSIVFYNGINKIIIESINLEKVDTVFDIKQINGYYLY
jgi:hypothetical protein